MFFDLALGIISAISLSNYFNLNLTSLIFPALLFSVLPDLDFIIYKLFGIHKDKGYKHRELFHYPLLYLPLGFFSLYFIIGNEIAWTFLVISTLHFLHDSIAYGRGVAWLYPFSKNGYAFIYEYSRVIKNGLWQPVFKFNNKYLEYFDREHGDENWIKNIYYSLHPIAIIEFSAFFLALIWLIIKLT